MRRELYRLLSVPAGKPATAAFGSYPVTITATNGVGAVATQTFTLTAYQDLTITNPPVAAFTPLVAQSFTFQSRGSPTPTFSETGALPAGVTLSSAGVLAGTPAQGSSGTYPFTVWATNGLSPVATQAFTLTVGLVITTSTLPAGVEGGTYSTTLAATGGTVPYRWKLEGSLPKGLHLDTRTGVISGRAKASGMFLFTVRVKGEPAKSKPHTRATATAALTIVIS